MILSLDRRGQLAGLEGLISEQVGLRLAGLAAAVPDGQAIVEVGSFKGKSTCYLAEGSRHGAGVPVFAVDPWELPGNPNGKHGFAQATTRERFHEQITRLGFEDLIVPVTSFSVVAAGVWQRGTSGRPIGLLYIDGSHTYSDVRADVEAWTPHLALGAIVVFDDYQTPRNPGVTRLVDELQQQDGWDAWDFETPPLAVCRRSG